MIYGGAGMEFDFITTQTIPTFDLVRIGDWFIRNGLLYIKTTSTEAICISAKQGTTGLPRLFSDNTEVYLVTKVDIHFSR